MAKRLYKLADGRYGTVTQTPKGIIVRTSDGKVRTVTTGKM